MFKRHPAKGFFVYFFMLYALDKVSKPKIVNFTYLVENYFSIQVIQNEIISFVHTI